MAHHHVETNPHFIDPEEITPEQRDYLPSTLLPRHGHDHRIPHRTPSRGHQDQLPQPSHLQGQGERSQPLDPSPTEPRREGEPPLPIHVWVPPVHHEGDQLPSTQPPHGRQGQPHHRQPLEMWMPTQGGPPRLSVQGPLPRSSVQGPAPKKQRRKTKPPTGVVMAPQLQDQHPSPSLVKPQDDSTQPHPSPATGVTTPQPQGHGYGPGQSEGRHPHEHRPHPSLFLPRDRQTKPLAWFAAAFCMVLWLIVIIGGLIVLIVYLLFRPRSPRFDVNSVTLNAAYLDMGYLLNADLSLLANFTNPNKKVRIDFSYMYLDLYFENSLIATQYIEPFSAGKRQSMFANIHMVTSQVRLSMKETLLLQKQIQNNRVMLTVKGRFRTRSNLGSFLKYSYWLHGQCSIIVSSPPTGVLKQKYCRTKR